MAQKTDRKSPVHSKLTGIQNLRSVNIAIDINDPSRLVGYVPTNKALSLTTEVLSSLIGRNDTRSFAIAAPYGSGKSSIALFWAQLVENSPHKAPELKTLIESFKRHTPSRENVFFQWEKQHAFGLTIPLVGAESTDVFALVHQGILDALRRRGLKELAKDIARLNPDFGGFQKTVDLLSRANRIIGGRLLIIWDEFGKFLEQAVATGDGKAMLHIQTLAEYCSRTKENFPVVFVILLHQSFARYASSMPAYVRNEWAKVEGRFRQINYIEDSKEVYELISQVVSRKHGQPASDRKTFEALAKSCHQVQIFKDFDRESLVDLLWSAAPLSPVSLYLLPRISARVAQNERSLFSFLSSQEPHALPSLNKEWITPADLYDYFEDLMRVDTSVGGSHRLWVEANAALKKAETEKEKELIKALSCIKLGSSSNSLPGSLPVINLAFGQTDKKSESEWQRLADRLLRAKAIYYKKLSGEYSVWQGADVDIRSAVEEQKGKFLETLELVPILAKNFPCPYRFPQRYNDHYYIRRYFDGRYASLDDLKTLRYSIVPFQDDPFLDGRILYVPVETKEDWEEACRLAKESSLPDNVVIAIPQSPIVLREPLAEMLAYQELLRDPDFLGQDPILDKELKILADENEQFLRGLMDRLIQPSEHGPIFFSGGKKYDSVASMGELKRLLSKITEKVFPLTPRFNNEMINKTDPTPQIVNARKNILWGILQSYGKEDLGLKGYGPDVSIFRATFLLNGLYRKQDIGEWTFEDNPENLKDAGLKAVWREVVQYFTDPRYSPRDLSEFIEKLKSPPYGVRQGLIPLLIGAGLKVPRNPVHILEDGVYVKELRPDMIEKMSRHPKNFRVTVYELSPEFKKYLNEIIDMFSAAPSPKEGDPVRMAIAVMMGWLKNLPPICKAPGLISKDAESLISTLLNAKDPNLLLNEEFGKLTGTNTLSERVIWLRRAKLEIETVEENHKKLVKDFLVKAINADPELIRESYRKWKFQLPGIDDLSLLRRYDIDQVASGFLMRIGQNYDDEDLFIRSLAEIFSGQPLKFWDSNSLAQFEIRLGQTIRVIEETADQISMEMIDKGMPASGQQITSSWIERRLQRHIEQLVRHIGKSETKNYLDSLVEKLGGLN